MIFPNKNFGTNLITNKKHNWQKRGGGDGRKKKKCNFGKPEFTCGSHLIIVLLLWPKMKTKKFAMKIKYSLKNHFAINRGDVIVMAQKIFFCNEKQKMWHIRILVLWW